MAEEITAKEFGFDETEEEKLSKKKESKGSLLVVDEGEELDWNLDEEIGEYVDKELKIDRVDMKAVARRSISVKILRFLLKHKRDFSNKELHTKLGIANRTVNHNLRKVLLKSGVLELVVPRIDKRNKCYRIVNSKVAEAIITLHDRFASFELAKLLPYSGYASISELKENPKFLEKCEKFKLEPDEGIECLKLNTRKVEIVFSKTPHEHGMRLVNEPKREIVGFKRKEQ